LDEKIDGGIIPRRARLDVQRALRPIIIGGMERRFIFADDLDGEKIFGWMGQQALETGTKIYARFLFPHEGPILL
jgi:hypothetical protein